MVLSSVFETVVMVSDEPSLIRAGQRLGAPLVIFDLALANGDLAGTLQRLRGQCPDLRVLVLSIDGQPNVEKAVLKAGADAFLVKRDLSSGLLAAIDSALKGSVVDRGSEEITKGPG